MALIVPALIAHAAEDVGFYGNKIPFIKAFCFVAYFHHFAAKFMAEDKWYFDEVISS